MVKIKKIYETDPYLIPLMTAIDDRPGRIEARKGKLTCGRPLSKARTNPLSYGSPQL